VLISNCGCTLKELKFEYSLEEAMMIWESYHISRLNEYLAVDKARKEAERKMKSMRRR
jgi:hypothetical protein